MSSKLIPAVLAAILAASPMAVLAATTGNYNNALVQSVNPQTLSVTLNDGTTFDVADQAMLKQLTPGAHVDLSYRDVNGSTTITNVTSAG